MMTSSSVLVVAFVALSLPALSSAFLFGVTLTTTAGATAFSATATQLGYLALGVLGAKVALVSLGLLVPRSKTIGTYTTYQPSKGYYTQYRGKRDVVGDEEEIALNEVMDDLMVEIHAGKVEGCFERLFCDIAARPDDFPRNAILVAGIENVASQTSNAQAQEVTRKLMGATRYGKFLNQHTAYDATSYCEQVYNQCPWTGKQLDQVISQYEQLAVAPPVAAQQ